MCVRGGGDGCRRETMRGWAAWCAREGCSFWFYGACINANLLLRCCTIVSSFLPNERLITGPRAVHGCIIVFRQVDPPAAAALIVIGGLHEGWTVRSAINRIQKRFLCVVVLKKIIKKSAFIRRTGGYETINDPIGAKRWSRPSFRTQAHSKQSLCVMHACRFGPLRHARFYIMQWKCNNVCHTISG